MTLPELTKALRHLRLGGIAALIEMRLQQAQTERLAPVDFLSMLVTDELTRRADLSGRRSVLVTFHPHPLRVVRPADAPPLLTPTPEKKILLAESGVHHAVILPFTRELQQLSARDFVVRILLARLGMRELVIGYDHGFGRGREGSVETMRELGQEHTMLLSTHILSEVEATCDSVIVIYQGQVVEDGALADVRKRHKNKPLEDIFVRLTGQEGI